MSDLRTIICRLVAGTSIVLSLFVASSLPALAEGEALTYVYIPAPYVEVSPTQPETALWLAPFEQDMLAEHNRLRAAAGAGPLTVDPQLERIARERATDMAVRSYFSHTSPSGQTAFDLMDASGFVAYGSAENIASSNYPASQAVSVAMNGFMNSTGHRESLLNPMYTRAGIGYNVAADGTHYFAVLFATP
jgi:uncharacterized protein YkwD